MNVSNQMCTCGHHKDDHQPYCCIERNGKMCTCKTFQEKVLCNP